MYLTLIFHSIFSGKDYEVSKRFHSSLQLNEYIKTVEQEDNAIFVRMGVL